LKARLIFFIASVIAVFGGLADTWLAWHDGGGF
jgi:hypothetical protein